MDCHATTLLRRYRPCLVLLLFALTKLSKLSLAENSSPPSPVPAQPTPITRAFRNDAALNSISFVNQSTGWAVGDRGVIWHTEDAGATWLQQTSPVSCSLNAVFFVDAHRGWAVGGQCQPYAGATRGVVLRTDDGGVTWQQLAQPILPSLSGVRFFDRDHGIAFGQSATYSPSGVYSTRDAGNTWQPLPSDTSGNWLAGDFLEPNTGAVAGPAGRIATLIRRKVVDSPLSASSLRSFRAMRLVAPTGGWAVGDGGLLMTTSDLGHSWQTPPASLPETATDHFDFGAVAVAGPHVWIAGSPGTRIFHSADNGQTWQSAATGQSAPLHSLEFIDPDHGWATGALGNILSTHDGGQSWQTQRTGAARAALLAIFANPADVPLELLADSGAAEGYITAIDILCTSSTAPGEISAATSQRTREALLLAGAAATNTSWRFPLPAADLALEPKDLLAALNRDNDGHAMQQIERHLVRELRMWRPDVIVIPHGSTRATSDPIAALLEPIIASAVTAAADATQHTELATDVGLTPWQVKKVYGLAPPGARGEESIDPAHFSPWLGASLADFAAPARAILFAEHTVPPESLQLKSLLDSTTPTNARGIFSGISLARGSDARRQQPDLPVQDIDNLRRLATRRRNLEQLLERTQGNTAWTAQVNQMLDGLSDEDCGQLLVQLAEGYRKAGRLDLAADTYFLFARRTPDHPLVDPALTWLIQFYASGESSHRLCNRANNIRPSTPADKGEPASAIEPATAGTSNKVQQTAALTSIAASSPPANNLSHDDRLRRTAQLADYLKTARPALYAEPAVRFAEVTAQRQLGFANPAKRFFLSLRQLPESDPWRQCAAIEEWLDKPGDAPPAKKLATCRLASAPPHLDGNLDDSIWQTADHIFLRDADSAPRTGKGTGDESNGADVRITHDSEFLYLAVHCLKAANVDYQSDDSPRPRDADLTQHDRVSLKLDVDRDYTSAFELTVDSRGWTSDACCGDATWNPMWYVAAANDQSSWTVEAAIPLSELVEKPPTARNVWALAVRRTIPRTGYQTWSATTTSEDSPAQFGLLIFE